MAVAFWNFVGAGLFGFMINPPIALYYVQGLNLTPVHGHAALFGVYGMLGLGLMLFCLRALRPGLMWKDRPLAIAFWSHQHRSGSNDPDQHVARRAAASLGFRRVRHLVCALGGVHANAAVEPPALDADDSAIRSSPSGHWCSDGLSWDSSPDTLSTTPPRSTRENTRLVL